MPAKSRSSQVARTKVLGGEKPPRCSAQDTSSTSAQHRICMDITKSMSSTGPRTGSTPLQHHQPRNPNKSNCMVRSHRWRTSTQIHANEQDPQTRGGTLRSMRCYLRKRSSDSGTGTPRICTERCLEMAPEKRQGLGRCSHTQILVQHIRCALC